VATDIRIGTASWTDPGFLQDWYPPGLPANARLRWYAQHFNYVEVNSTFYGLPRIEVVERWCRETPEDFLFDIKLPKILSRHSMQAKFLPPELRPRLTLNRDVVQLTPPTQELVVHYLLRVLGPMIDAGKLGAFLLQLSPVFRPRTHSLAELDSLAHLLVQHRLAVELRNRDWVSENRLQETLGYFRSRRLTLVLVDAPRSEHFTVMPGLDCVTNPKLAYFRFHGRNEPGYIRGRTVAERFDYDYPEPEVKELAERVRKVAREVDELRVVANNNRSNYAPKLARRLQELLHVQRRLREALGRKTSRQAELF
jgi:uncharacterized protein YecE (DUF72 family)